MIVLIDGKEKRVFSIIKAGPVKLYLCESEVNVANRGIIKGGGGPPKNIKLQWYLSDRIREIEQEKQEEKEKDFLFPEL